MRIQSYDLNQALKIICQVVQKRSHLPILKMMKVGMSPGVSTSYLFHGTDLDNHAEVIAYSVAQRLTRGFCINPHDLLAFTKNLNKNSILELEYDDFKVTVDTGSSKRVFDAFPEEEYPHFPKESETQKVLCASSNTLIETFKHAVVATGDSKETRTAMTCAKWDGDKLVSTDGRRMLIQKVPEFDTCLIPKSACSLLAKLPKQTPVTLNTEGNHIFLSYDNVRYAFRLSEYTFPDWKRVVPESFTGRIEYHRETLLQALEACKPDKGAKDPHVIICDDKVYTSDEKSYASAGTQLSVHSDETKFGFSYKYLVDFLKMLTSDYVLLNHQGDVRASMWQAEDFEEGEAKKYILMPIKLRETVEES